MEITEALVKRVQLYLPYHTLTHIRQTLVQLANLDPQACREPDILFGLVCLVGNYLAKPTTDDTFYKQAVQLLINADHSILAYYLWHQWLEKRDSSLERYLLAQCDRSAYWKADHHYKKGPLTLCYKAFSLAELQHDFKGVHVQYLLEAAYRDSDLEIRQKARHFLIALPDEVIQNEPLELSSNKDGQYLFNLFLECTNTLTLTDSTQDKAEAQLILSKLILILRYYKNHQDSKSHRIFNLPWLIDHVCDAWLKSRSPFLAQVLVEQKWVANKTSYCLESVAQACQYKVFSALKCNQIDQIDLSDYLEVEALVAACTDPDSDIAERANVLLQKVPKERTDTLARLWVVQRLPQLFEWLVSNAQIPTKPLEARLLVALKLTKTSVLTNTINKKLLSTNKSEAEEAISILVQACEHSDQIISENARKLLPQFVKADHASLFYQLVIENDWPLLQKLVIEVGLKPIVNSLSNVADEMQLALFYFVTDQWELYEQLDFDQRLLQKAYNNAAVGSKLRRRLIAKIPQMGRSDLLELLIIKAGNRDELAQSHLTQTVPTEEAEVLVQTLAAHADWPQLFRVLFELPLRFSIETVRYLAAAHWQPTTAAEQEILGQLQSVVQTEILTDVMLPLATIHSQPNLIGVTAIYTTCFSPINTTLAIAVEKDGQSQVLLWDLTKNEPQAEVIEGFKEAVGNIVFLSETKLICAEQARSHLRVSNIYRWQRGGQLEVIGQHGGAISALAVLNEYQILTAGQDRRVVLWDTRGEKGRQLSVGQHRQLWSRFICVPSTPSSQLNTATQWIATLDDGIFTFSLPDLQLIADHNYSRFSNPKVRAVGIAPDGQSLIISRNNTKLGVCSFDEIGGSTFELAYFGKEIGAAHSAQVIKSLEGLQMFVVSQADGMLSFYEWPSCNLFAQLSLLTDNVDGLKHSKLAANGNFMATVSINDTLTIWDLRSLPIQLYLANKALGPNGSSLLLNSLVELQQQAEKLGLTQAVCNSLKFIELALGYRLRHTIELSELPNIVSANEHDIELDDLLFLESK
jgi:WD40 repeat protein